MLNTWLLYHRGRWAELPAALQRIEAALAQVSLPPDDLSHLQGEMAALRSLLCYHAIDPESALASAQEALVKTPRELWIVRILARLFLAGVLQMRGDSNQAHAAIYRALEEEETQSRSLKATMVMTVCWLDWVEANLQSMAQTARQCIALSQQADIPQILNYGHYHLGRVCYQQNDLAAAEEHFSAIVRQPYLNYGECFAYGACGLALVHQAQDRTGAAQAVTEAASMYLLETGNTTLMPVIQAIEAELALKQGRIAQASQWAAQLDPVPPLTSMVELFCPHLTLVRIWMAQNTHESLQRAAGLLEGAREFVESTHNSRFLIEVLALQALLKDVDGDRGTALELLAQAVTLAEPGGFIRLFVDLGPQMARLLAGLHRQDVAPVYVSQILGAFETTDDGQKTTDPTVRRSLIVGGLSSPLVDPLTPRELEVLVLLDRHLTNNEIAEELVVSPSTVKTHTLNIYRKLVVHSRKQAVARARELSILP
jgi:LuxR family maltose regulon positive regulatory protein